MLRLSLTMASFATHPLSEFVNIKPLANQKDWYIQANISICYSIYKDIFGVFAFVSNHVLASKYMFLHAFCQYF